MESVRFSIIENNLHWEDENKQDLLMSEVDDDRDNGLEDDDDNNDQSSISSENSCCDALTPESSPSPQKAHISQLPEVKVWHSIPDIDESILKDLPNAEEILDDLVAENWENIFASASNTNTALLLSISMGRLSYVIRLLSNFYADVNITETNGRSALHLACSIGNAAIAKFLIEHGAFVNEWDNSKSMTPLHCAAMAGSIECIRILLENGANVNAGIETRSALHLAVEKNAVDCVELLLKNKANPNTPQVYTETTLHTAAALGHLECMRLLLRYGADVRSMSGSRRMTALHLAAENDYSDCVKLLIDNGAKVNVRNVENKTPLHLACLSQCAETVELLIESGADVNAVYKDGRSALHAAIVNESKCLDCTRNLLSAGADVNQADNYGYTPLHIAALNESSACALLLIEYGADVTARTGGGVSALSFIVRRTPEVIPKFIAKFDSSIKVNEHEIGDVDCEIKLDLRLLVPNAERGETELLLAFIEVGQKRILKHPLCETFIFLKWRRIRKFFLFSLLYHAIYVTLFTLLILGIYEKNCPTPVAMDRAITFETEEEIRAKYCKTPQYVGPVGYVVIFMNALLLAKEFFQMSHGFVSYIKYWENWVQWIIICGVFFCATPSTLYSGNLQFVPEWQYHVAAIVIFLVWVELMMIVGRFPIFGLYVQMFTKVAKNFAKFLLAYCCLLVAFGLSFGVLFNSYPAFKSVPWTLLKTITMMSGELEFEDIFYGDVRIQFPGTSHALFFAFVVLVTIILTNLLVGLAVSDIQGLQASAGLDRLTRQAELVARLESIFFSKLLRKAPSSLLLMLQRSALLRTSRYHLQFCVRPNDPRDNRLPKDLVVGIYKLVAERRDRNMSMKRRRHEMNFSSFFAQNMTRAMEDGAIQLRNPSSQLKCGPVPVYRPQSVNTTQMPIPKTVRYCTPEPNMFEIDVKIRAVTNQLTEMTTKLQSMQETVAKNLEIFGKEIAILRLRLEKNI